MELTAEKSVIRPVDKAPVAVYRIICLNRDFEQYLWMLEKFGNAVQVEYFDTKQGVVDALAQYFPADVVMAHENAMGFELLQEIRADAKYGNIPFIILVDRLEPERVSKARQYAADDIFDARFSKGDLLARLQYFNKRHWYIAEKASRKIASNNVKIPFWKRSMDLIVTGSALLVLLPLLLLVALVIRLDSKGPVIYKSKRVGSGYKIFSLYKFRTMRIDADSLMRQMSALNMYNRSSEPKATEREDFMLCSDCTLPSQCSRRLFLDGKEICEIVHSQQKEQKAAFMKFQNDPRITRVGQFLRNTSLDELPQLFNIVRGDMSLVGNRPLPLYEAEKLTTDFAILRFAGPAGLTGLWQVTKRGKGKSDMSEEERTELDVRYAQEFSFGMDMQIILKTFPALLQTENV
ncbi:sugar transferase [Dyadobacter jejuensis]|uniref:Sugar transferase n=1 Tax=Dyadobacter jejuensis TaxID=1082580 RepID=A0A316AM00_9BACT|nr:sugar transferase [Dyadobacter jejuensis]PWJ58773.1 sugar transferase [Dyadobacter jejuensis]